MGGFGETPQNELGFAFIDTNAAAGVQSLLGAGGGAQFYSNNALSRVNPNATTQANMPTVPPLRPSPGGMYLVNEGPGAIRYTSGGSIPTQQPNTQMGILVPAGGVVDWTNALTNYSGLIRNFQFVVVSGQAVLQVSWRD